LRLLDFAPLDFELFDLELLDFELLEPLDDDAREDRPRRDADALRDEPLDPFELLRPLDDRRDDEPEDRRDDEPDELDARLLLTSASWISPRHPSCPKSSSISA
jgi:hypothetical protein